MMPALSRRRGLPGVPTARSVHPDPVHAFSYETPNVGDDIQSIAMDCALGYRAPRVPRDRMSSADPPPAKLLVHGWLIDRKSVV